VLFTMDTYYTPVALGEPNSADFWPRIKTPGLAAAAVGTNCRPLVIQAKAPHYPTVPAAQFAVTAMPINPPAWSRSPATIRSRAKKGETLAEPLTVAVHDAFGNGVSARPVRFSVLSGGGH
jgi:hypothetical protein